MFGILNINKPSGWTSRDVVNRIYGLLKPMKVGHTGTLDPLATGVLIVAVGKATRLIQYSHRLPKRYRATFHLGRSSPSDDIDTDVQIHEGAPQPSKLELEAMLPEFVGTIQQRPPAYAAVKIEGKRAYKLARRGEEVQLEPRPVNVHSLELVDYEYPELVLDIKCGSGTYVRAIGRDLAERLGTAAVMSALERIEIGGLNVSTAVEMSELREEVSQHLSSPLSLVESLERVTLTEEQILRLLNGLTIELPETLVRRAPLPTAELQREIVGLDSMDRIVTIIEKTPTGEFKPLCNFPRSL